MQTKVTREIRERDRTSSYTAFNCVTFGYFKKHKRAQESQSSSDIIMLCFITMFYYSIICYANKNLKTIRGKQKKKRVRHLSASANI